MKDKTQESPNSTYMKLLQLWLTGFAVGIPSLRLLLFFDFRYSEIIVAVFLTILIFATMYILDVNDRAFDADYVGNGVVADAEHSFINSTNKQNKVIKSADAIVARGAVGQIFDEHIQLNPQATNVL